MKVKLTLLAACFSLALPYHASVQALGHGNHTHTEKSSHALPEKAVQVDMTSPYLLIEHVAKNTFGLLHKDSDLYQKNPELLRNVAKDNILPYINVRYAALKVLGPAAKKATKAQRDAFTHAFYDYLVAAYAQILTQYTNQDVVVEPSKTVDPNRRVASVRVDITDAARPPIRMDFKLRKNTKTQEWQGFDVQVEGVSMLETKASEWSGILRREGIDAVTKMLIETAQKPISNQEAKK